MNTASKQHSTLRRAVAAVAAAALCFSPAALAADPLKVGFVYVSPIGDAGWTFQHELGRRALETKMGGKVETSYVENVPEGADAERVIRNLASKGHGLIFTTSFGYMEPTLKVAPRFPKVVFEHATGYKTAENMGNYTPRFYEGRYLGGIVAGAMSKKNVIGYVGAFPIPEVVRGINAFLRGAQTVNPNMTVKVVWVNSWYDPVKEREAADTLLAQGADVLTHHTDSPAAVQAAKEAGAMSVGYHSDMAAYGGDSQLAAVVHKWEDFYQQRVQEVLDGSWTSRSVWEGMDKGMIDIVSYSPRLPADLKAKVEKAKADIIAGRLHPFDGPVHNQQGEVMNGGQRLTDKDLLGMNYYVKGVEGELPK